MNPEQEEIEVLTNAARFLDEKLIDEFVNQGHHLTGALEQAIGYDLGGNTVVSSNRSRVIGTMPFYGIYVNQGVKADRIPFNAGSGAKESKYIKALVAYWKLRGLSDKEAKAAAFATANKQKKEGMPTMGSYKFTATGQRRTFVNTVDDLHGPTVDKIIGEGQDMIIDSLFHETKSETI